MALSRRPRSETALFVRVVTLRNTPIAEETAGTYLADLRALTLARHAGYWAYLMQMYRSPDDVEQEMLTYLPEFALNLEPHFGRIVGSRFEPTPADDEALKPWTMALSLHGSVWVDGLEHSVPVAALMEALWKSEIG